MHAYNSVVLFLVSHIPCNSKLELLIFFKKRLEEMVSDSELVNRLREILRSSDLNTATVSSVRRQLEEEFGVSLHDRKVFIREQIHGFVDARENHQEGGSNDEEEMKEDEEENEGSGFHQEEVRSKKKRSHKMDKNEKKKGSGFSKPWAISLQLQKIVGVPEMARTEVVKKMWEYIREKNLQNPKDKRKIICDETLRGIFQVKSINMFQMNKALSKHIWPIDADDLLKNDAPKHQEDQEEAEEDSNDEEMEEESENVKPEESEGRGFHEVDKEAEEDDDDDQEKEEEESDGVRSKKRRSHKMDTNENKKRSGFTKPCAISPQLQEIVGLPEMARTEVVKKIWAYIREKNLQNPKDKRKIVCDEKLHGIFGVSTINMFQMNKVLSKHIWPIDAENCMSFPKP
ncbi:hypothetical protein ACH5RR_002269 [Cinchona calisaya]|uniref:Uncharacterized protein n=1 Tax=Cinchona calisaya TaxID=153742 RepID=A0ABD3B6F4_9GENT